MEFYHILGIAKTSSQEEVKQSYKKLILEHHPDKGGDVEQFKKIQEAYETLGNPDKRMVYDTPKQMHGGIEISFNGNFMNIVRQFRKPIQRIDITTTFDELYSIYSKVIQLPFNITFNYPLHCRKLQLQGEPNNFLIVNTLEIPSEFQIVNNFDLLITQKITFYEALNGIIFQVELPTETLNLKKTPIIKDNDVFSIPNKGLLRDVGIRGNLIIKFVLIYPSLNEEKLKMLKDIV